MGRTVRVLWYGVKYKIDSIKNDIYIYRGAGGYKFRRPVNSL